MRARPSCRIVIGFISSISINATSVSRNARYINNTLSWKYVFFHFYHTRVVIPLSFAAPVKITRDNFVTRKKIFFRVYRGRKDATLIGFLSSLKQTTNPIIYERLPKRIFCLYILSSPLLFIIVLSKKTVGLEQS